jgi:YVTN family beta-propeller protein
MNNDLPPVNYYFGGGVYVVNEGNFNKGNGSLSLFSYDSLKIFNNLFTSTNNRPLGDVPNSMTVNSDKAYIIVNNSGKIEVINIQTLKSTGVITGLKSPRNMAVFNGNKAYVTSLYSDSLTIVDLNTNAISGYINLEGTSEAIIIAGSNAYVSNWVGGKTVKVISTLTNKVVNTITVGSEPESMVIDKYNRLWVLCPGGWQRNTNAELDVINLKTGLVENKYLFPALQNSPSCLKIDALGQTLYYIDNGVWKMDVNASSLPVQPLIPQSNNAYFYKIAVNPVNSDILVTDAGDFTHDGFLSVYKNDGTPFYRNSAGIIPGSMAFHLSINSF